jgi:hypothetical protein
MSVVMAIVLTVLLDQVINLLVFTLKQPFSDLQLNYLLIELSVFPL